METARVFSSGSMFMVSLVLGLLALDSFSNPELVHKLIGISSHQLVIPSLLVLFFTRQKAALSFPAIFRHITEWLVIALSIFTPVITLYDAVAHENALFALTRLHQSQLLLMTLYALLALGIMQTPSWWQKNHQKVVLFTPYAAFACLFLAWLFPFDLFLEIVKEDRLIEYLQFFVLLGGVGMNAVRAVRLSAQQSSRHRRAMLWCVLFAVGLAFVAGDEISWGQRLMNLPTTEPFAVHNRQGELTIHNLYAVEWLVLYTYIALSWVGLIGKSIVEKIRPLTRLTSFFPDSQLTGYFLFPALFFLAQYVYAGGIYQEWSEPAELFLYTGIVLWTIQLPQITRTLKQ